MGLGQWRGSGEQGNNPPNFSLSRLSKIIVWVKNFLSKSIIRKRIFTLKLRKPGWSEQSKVVSECILKCSLFMQTDVL